MIKYHFYSGVLGIIIWILLLPILFLLVKWFNISRNEFDANDSDFNTVKLIMSTAFLVITGIIFLVISIVDLPEDVTKVICPEWYVIQDLINIVK